jgi:hypothetical protein
MSNRKKLRQHTTRYWLLEFYNTEHGPVSGHCTDCGKHHEADPSAEMIGAAIVPGRDFDQAVERAWDMDCNPGGSVAGAAIRLGLIENAMFGEIPVREMAGILLPSDIVPKLQQVLSHWWNHHMPKPA